MMDMHIYINAELCKDTRTASIVCNITDDTARGFPRNVHEALAGIHSELWMDAIQREIERIGDANTVIVDSGATTFVTANDTNLRSFMLRIRGGAPNSDKNFNDIPYLTNMKFLWNGLPCIEFNERIMYPLNMGLGSFYHKGATLLRTAMQRDPGGALGIPTTAGANQQILNEHLERVERLFCCIMNYIDHRSETYKLFMREYDNNGVAIYLRMRTMGNVRIPKQLTLAREDTWNRMTYESARIPWTFEGIFKWAEKVIAQGRILNKDDHAMLMKFADEMPAFASEFKENMKRCLRDPTCHFPATYGAIPGNALHPRAAAPHPLAGRVDLMIVAAKHYESFCTNISKTTKFILPNGFIRSAEDMERDEFAESIGMDVANLLSSEVTKDTVCTSCGHKGHAATQVLKNGMTLVCPQKVLMREHPETFGSGKDKSDSHVRELEEQIYSLQSQITEMEQDFAHKLQQHNRRNIRRNTPFRPPTPNTSSTHLAQSSNAESEESEYETYSAERERDEGHPFDDGYPNPSMQQEFAEQAMNYRRFGKKPLAKKSTPMHR